MSGDAELDKWAAWLLHRRDGDDPEQRAKALEHLLPIRERVLANARLAPGETLLDVGAGDGLIALGALERVGPSGHVIFSDVSEGLLSHARSIAAELRVGDQMSFVEASADDLAPVDDASVDVVTTRSVLIYVADKARAMSEFYRVLRGGGRVSIFEPINNYFADTPNEFWGFDSSAVSDLVERMWEYEGWSPDAHHDDPMMNFNTKDLVRHAENAGFDEVHVELFVNVESGSWVIDWPRLLTTAPNPNAQTPGEVMRGALTAEESDRFERHLKPLVDGGDGIRRAAFAYLWAAKHTKL